MPHARTTYGTFQKASQSGDYATYILDVCLPWRLKAIADSQTVTNMDVGDFATQNPTITISMEGNSEGCPNPPLKRHETEYKYLRVDKQHSYYLKINSVPSFYVTLQVQYASGQGAHGGVLLPYNQGFSFSELREALRTSIMWDVAAGYSLMHAGNPAPTHTNAMTDTERGEAYFNFFKKRFGAILTEDVKCRKCSQTYKSTLTQLEKGKLRTIQLSKAPLKNGDGVSLFCKFCRTKELHLLGD